MIPIICHKCKEPVEYFSVEQEGRKKMIYTVYCHGDSQTIIVDSATILNAKNIEFLEAFRDD